jgi:hypothetical protein
MAERYLVPLYSIVGYIYFELLDVGCQCHGC